MDIGGAVGAVAAAVHLDVLQPLDVRLGVAVNLAVELHITAHHHRLIGRQPRLEDGPVGGALCGGKTASVGDAGPRPAKPPPRVTPLTQDVQLVGVGDGAVLVLHHAGVVAAVGRHGALHHQAPLLVSQLGGGKRSEMSVPAGRQPTRVVVSNHLRCHRGKVLEPFGAKMENGISAMSREPLT